jgi:hypothetical protein
MTGEVNHERAVNNTVSTCQMLIGRTKCFNIILVTGKHLSGKKDMDEGGTQNLRPFLGETE